MTQTETNKTVGTALLITGIALLAIRLSGITVASLLWPLWALVPGLAALFMAFRSPKASIGWAVPGALIAGTGAILFTLNLTGAWETFAYLWTLYPAFIGGALYFVGRRNGQEGRMKAGRTTARVGFSLLLVFGLFFEVLIYGSLNFLGSPLIPLALVAAGLLLVFGRDRVRLGVLNTEKPKRVVGISAGDPVTGINPNLRRQMDAALGENADD